MSNENSVLNDSKVEFVSNDTNEHIQSVLKNRQYSGIAGNAKAALNRLSEKNNNKQIGEVVPFEQKVTKISFNNAPFKCDAMSMMAPVYSLSKPINPPKDKFNAEAQEKYNARKNIKIKERRWKSVNGEQELMVMPTALGQPTMNYKKIIIYIISCLVQLKNDRLPISRKVRFHVHDYLIATHTGVGKEEYERFEQGLDRYVTTAIKTNLKSNRIEITSVFSLIDSYHLSKVEGRCEYVEVTISEWLFNAVEGFDVITISEDYFDLKPIEKRVYEVARKHVGNQAEVKIGIKHLLDKSGSDSCLKEFNRMLRAIIDHDSLPDYRVKIIKDDAILYQKDVKKYAAALSSREAKKAAKK